MPTLGMSHNAKFLERFSQLQLDDRAGAKERKEILKMADAASNDPSPNNPSPDNSSQPSKAPAWRSRRMAIAFYTGTMVAVSLATIAVMLLWQNINERKREARQRS